jgi:hypothetical protein
LALAVVSLTPLFNHRDAAGRQAGEVLARVVANQLSLR